MQLSSILDFEYWEIIYIEYWTCPLLVHILINPKYIIEYLLLTYISYYISRILNLSFAGVPARLCVGGPSQPVVVEDGVRANLGFQNKLEIVGEMVKMVGMEMVNGKINW